MIIVGALFHSMAEEQFLWHCYGVELVHHFFCDIVMVLNWKITLLKSQFDKYVVWLYVSRMSPCDMGFISCQLP